MFRINDLFTSFQGEGRQWGRPSVFLRFQGCPIRCAFCDSRSTWVSDHVDPLSLDALKAQIRREKDVYPAISHMVLTGGEPFYDNPGLVDLCRWLLDGLFESVQIETSGAVVHAAFLAYLQTGAGDRVILTVSPKRTAGDDKAYAPVHPGYLASCSELKFVVADEADLTGRIPAFLDQVRKVRNKAMPAVSLQPVDGQGGDDALRLCLAAALENNWFLSVQTHKLIGIP